MPRSVRCQIPVMALPLIGSSSASRPVTVNKRHQKISLARKIATVGTEVTGLEPDTTYHFRVVAAIFAGTRLDLTIRSLLPMFLRLEKQLRVKSLQMGRI